MRTGRAAPILATRTLAQGIDRASRPLQQKAMKRGSHDLTRDQIQLFGRSGRALMPSNFPLRDQSRNIGMNAAAPPG